MFYDLATPSANDLSYIEFCFIASIFIGLIVHLASDYLGQ